MSYLTGSWEDERNKALQKLYPNAGQNTVMRLFLEDQDVFQWPEDSAGLTRAPNEPNHCEISMDQDINRHIRWESKFSLKSASAGAFVDQYRCADTIAFRHAFAVKLITGYEQTAKRASAKEEVINMKDLRHPHVAALLGTFIHRERLNILIFPAACFDLSVFMESVSAENKDGCQLYKGYSDVRTENGPDYAWPLRAGLGDKLRALQKWFYCLSRALCYVHESKVRHKDIKPENILVDLSGSVVLTDFGISKKFLDSSLITSGPVSAKTNMWAAAECFKHQAKRSGKTDVFALGCVFTHMVSLVLGKNLEECEQNRTTTINAKPNHDYHQSLPQVRLWLESLQTPEPRLELEIPKTTSVLHDNLRQDSKAEMIAAIPTILSMLADNIDQRPSADNDLCEKFYFKSVGQCRDCHPKHPECWKPSKYQAGNEVTGRDKREKLENQKTLERHDKNTSLIEIPDLIYMPRDTVMLAHASAPSEVSLDPGHSNSVQFRLPSSRNGRVRPKSEDPSRPSFTAVALDPYYRYERRISLGSDEELASARRSSSHRTLSVGRRVMRSKESEKAPRSVSPPKSRTYIFEKEPQAVTSVLLSSLEGAKPFSPGNNKPLKPKDTWYSNRASLPPPRGNSTIAHDQLVVVTTVPPAPEETISASLRDIKGSSPTQKEVSDDRRESQSQDPETDKGHVNIPGETSIILYYRSNGMVRVTKFFDLKMMRKNKPSIIDTHPLIDIQNGLTLVTSLIKIRDISI